jgi:uncharacterized membrane protein
MKVGFLSFFVGLIVLLIMDAFWLAVMMPLVYRKHLSHILASSPSWWAAAIFYLFYAFGIYFLVVGPAISQNLGLTTIFFKGFVLGIVAYGTYDLTNQATLRDWPVLITALDITWGAFMTASISAGSSFIVRKLFF